MAFNRDLWDHLSEFHSGKRWYKSGFGKINPEGGEPGARIRHHNENGKMYQCRRMGIRWKGQSRVRISKSFLE